MKIPAATLILDPNIYPRVSGPVGSNIAQLAEALRAGETLPPVTATKETKRLVDGVNRWKAHIRVFGDDCEIPCELVDEAPDCELFVMAVRLNTAHGLGLSPFDRTSAMVRMEQLGVTRETAIAALRVTAETAERIQATKTAYRVGDSGEREKIALKGVMHGFAGETLTRKQEQANRTGSGMKAEYYVNQTISLVDAGIIRKGSKTLLARLFVLRDLLNERLPTTKSA